jgi:hypothetical protein
MIAVLENKADKKSVGDKLFSGKNMLKRSIFHRLHKSVDYRSTQKQGLKR